MADVQLNFKSGFLAELLAKDDEGSMSPFSLAATAAHAMVFWMISRKCRKITNERRVKRGQKPLPLLFRGISTKIDNAQEKRDAAYAQQIADESKRKETKNSVTESTSIDDSNTVEQ